MLRSDNLNELGAALAKAQGAIEGALKDSDNPFFKSKYADLASVWDACRQHLTVNGLSIVQTPTEADSGIGVETMLLHSSGQYVSERFTMPVSKADAQGVGSAITYARRYALAAMVGVAPEDDDGNAATKAAPKKQPLNPGKGAIVPNSGAGDELTAEQKQEMQELAAKISTLLVHEENIKAVEAFRSENDMEKKRYMWSLLPSNQRTTINSLTKK